MNQDKYVFSQLTAFLDRSKFNRIVGKYSGDYYVKHFTCWNQLLAMMFGQLSNRVSLRDLIVALDAHRSKCYHLGVEFFHITNASVHDSKVMKEIPVESGSYYIFDRAYNNFKQLYRIHQAGG